MRAEVGHYFSGFHGGLLVITVGQGEGPPKSGIMWKECTCAQYEHLDIELIEMVTSTH